MRCLLHKVECLVPELAEVEIVRGNLERWWLGRRADEVRVLDAKLAFLEGPLQALLTREVEGVSRRGKLLIVAVAGGAHVVFHLRMTGKIVRAEGPRPSSSARLAWRLGEGEWLVFKDRRRFAEVRPMWPGELEAFEPLQSMGPEPHDVDAARMAGLLACRRRLKDRLMDQRVIAGVGNIAVSEVFWRLGFHPEVRCDALTPDQIAALAAALPEYFDWLIEAERADEITYVNEGKNTPSPFSVYGRDGEPCPRCATPISSDTIGSRSSYFCTTCQPASPT